MYANEGDELSLAAVGDAILTRRISSCTEDRFTAVIDRIRDADVGIANLETLLHDFEGYPGAQTGGTPLRAPPRVADDLGWAGIDLVALANNHVMDFTYGGLNATTDALEAREIPYAGVGSNLAAARAPAYLDTPAGRVALVAASATFPEGAEAGPQRPDMQGRPGLSPLHTDATYTVPEQQFSALTEMSEALGLEAEKARKDRLGIARPDEADDELSFLDVTGGDLTFRPGDEYGIELHPDEDDVASIHDHIEAAARQADWVVASLHAHQGRAGRTKVSEPPAFHETFARACIDAGADIFVGHGPHILRGIEVYEGAPIFYSLGDFVLQNETIPRLPQSIYDRYDLGSDALPADAMDARFFADHEQDDGFLHDRAYWESVLPVCRFDDGTIAEIELLPLDLGVAAPRPQRGRPLLATDEVATRILRELQSYSEPYDTTIEIQGDRGVIRPG